MQRVTDLITTEDIATWKPETPVVISAGTGAGKSYFIKNTVYDFARSRGQKILMLIHRRTCKDQFEFELLQDGKIDVVEVSTYQKIDHDGLYNRRFVMDQYDYVVADEFHYFVSDAKFNHSTDVSFDALMGASKPIKILMSATSDQIEKFIKEEARIQPIKYTIPRDFSHIAQLKFYYAESVLIGQIKAALAKNEKAMVFMQSAEKAYSLYKEFKKVAMFCCSKDNKRHIRYMDEGRVKRMLQEEKFDVPLLITTCCMDSGVNIKDREVKHIFTDVSDVSSLIQCLGRKRVLDEADTVNIYIRAYNNNELGAMKANIVKSIKMANDLKNHTQHEWLEKYPRKADPTGIIYDAKDATGALVKRINKLMYWQRQQEMDNLTMMINFGEHGFCQYLARYLDKYDYVTGKYDYQIVFDTEDICQFLASYIGKPMLKLADRRELIERLNVRQDGKLLRSRSVLNNALEERQIPYRITQYRRKGCRSVWEVVPHDWSMH